MLLTKTNHSFDRNGVRSVRHEADQQKSLAIPWPEVVAVIASKRDCFAYDLVELHFISANGIVLIDEEFPEWTLLTQQLPDFLPGCLSFGDWYMDVAFPAFEENRKVIFKR